MKKIISFLLILTTVLSCFMLTVSADEQIVSDKEYLPFEDVKDSHWFSDAVEFCYVNNIIKGMTEYTFGFSGQLTRAQFVTMLANLEGVDTSTYSVDRFTDVKSSHWYYGAVAWAYSEGIVSGMTETAFQPAGVLTRAQLATVMKNYMAKKEYTVEINEAALDSFTDKPKTEYWYYDAMVYAVSAGLLSGNSNGTLAATGNVTRAQAAVIFKNFMEVYFYGDCEHELPVDCSSRVKCTKCGMVKGLATGHRFDSYDCGIGGICLNCNEDIPPRAHTNTETICERCGKEFFERALDKAAYYIMSKGQSQPGQHGMGKIYYYGISYEGSDTTTYLTYYPDDSIYIENYITYGNVLHMSRIRILFRGDTVNEYEYRYFEGDDCYFIGKGYIDKKTYTADTVEGFSSYEGVLDPAFTENINIILPDIVDDADYILDLLYGGSVRDLGFLVY
ncbi:MAG: S-layer homology domain-containing protein [Clostridia bacterium]|nr:S-layer homology domain-containing protein [Clostridia bacterium]